MLAYLGVMREAGFTRVANRDTRPTVIRVCPASNVLTQQLGNAVGLFGRMFMLKSLDIPSFLHTLLRLMTNSRFFEWPQNATTLLWHS